MQLLHRTVTTTALATLVAIASVSAQEDDRWCREGGGDEGEVAVDVRETRLPADRQTVRVDAGTNGGIRVHAWTDAGILVRACVKARAATDERAQELVRAVRVTTGGTIGVDGPRDLGRHEGWSVNFEVLVPATTNLDLEGHNGGIGIEGVRGDIEFRTTNGGVRLVGVGGDVHGSTTNGGLQVELTGTRWDGAGLDARTTNGGVTLTVPTEYHAELEAGTVNGGMNFEFPILVQGRLDRNLRTTLGDGGAPIRVKTTNGGVRVRRP